MRRKPIGEPGTFDDRPRSLVCCQPGRQTGDSPESPFEVEFEEILFPQDGSQLSLDLGIREPRRPGENIHGRASREAHGLSRTSATTPRIVEARALRQITWSTSKKSRIAASRRQSAAGGFSAIAFSVREVSHGDPGNLRRDGDLIG